MFKIIYCIRRKPSLTHEQFLAHWKNVHGELVIAHQATLRLARYAQTSPLSHAFSERVERLHVMQEPFDGVAELWWESEADLQHAFKSDAGKRVQRLLADDELLFIDHVRSCRWMATETQPI